MPTKQGEARTRTWRQFQAWHPLLSAAHRVTLSLARTWVGACYRCHHGHAMPCAATPFATPLRAHEQAGTAHHTRRTCVSSNYRGGNEGAHTGKMRTRAHSCSRLHCKGHDALCNGRTRAHICYRSRCKGRTAVDGHAANNPNPNPYYTRRVVLR